MEPSLDLLAIGAHPDDVELFAGGTLALLASAGFRVGALHLTRGECGTRGTPEIRARESADAARALGLAHVETLDLGDGRLDSSHARRLAVVDALRRLRPRVIATHDAGDRRHPDHRAAHELTLDACFLANVGEYPPRGEPASPDGADAMGGTRRPRHLVEEVVFFLGHEGREPQRPDWIVNLGPAEGEILRAKTAALAAYGTQFFSPGRETEGPATLLSSPVFATMQETRARRFGQSIGVEFGEGFALRSTPHAGHAFVRMILDAMARDGIAR